MSVRHAKVARGTADLCAGAAMSEEHLALTLLPVWVLPVRYAPDKPVVRLLVNGQTGRVFGDPPRSWLKIALAVGLALGVVGLFVLLVIVLGNL